MPGYSYVAVDQRGKEKRGKIDAENRDAVAQQLKKDGLFPVECFLPAVRQYHPGRCSDEGSPADDDGADRK